MSDLEYQAATLAARHAGLWIAAAHVVIGLLQCAVVGYGIYAMVRANNERARAASEDRREARAARAADQRAADQRHTESMAALKALIERTSEGGR